LLAKLDMVTVTMRGCRPSRGSREKQKAELWGSSGLKVDWRRERFVRVECHAAMKDDTPLTQTPDRLMLVLPVTLARASGEGNTVNTVQVCRCGASGSPLWRTCRGATATTPSTQSFLARLSIFFEFGTRTTAVRPACLVQSNHPLATLSGWPSTNDLRGESARYFFDALYIFR
jgi:hypothetical protein